MTEIDADAYIVAIRGHAHVLEALQTGPRRQVDLVDRLDRSRRAVSNSLERLEELQLVEQSDGCWELTLAGESAIDILQFHDDNWATLAKSSELLVQLPNDAPIGCEMMNGMDVIHGLDAAPQAAFEPVEEAIRAADHVQGFAPIVVSEYVDVIYEEAVEEGTEIELVLPKDVIFAIIDSYSEEWQRALASANCEVWRMDQTPDYGLIIVDQSEVYVGIYRDGTLAAVLKNNTPESVEWATEVYECCRSNTVRVLPPTDM